MRHRTSCSSTLLSVLLSRVKHTSSLIFLLFVSGAGNTWISLVLIASHPFCGLFTWHLCPVFAPMLHSLSYSSSCTSGSVCCRSLLIQILSLPPIFIFMWIILMVLRQDHKRRRVEREFFLSSHAVTPVFSSSSSAMRHEQTWEEKTKQKEKKTETEIKTKRVKEFEMMLTTRIQEDHHQHGNGAGSGRVYQKKEEWRRDG